MGRMVMAVTLKSDAELERLLEEYRQAKKRLRDYIAISDSVELIEKEEAASGN